MQYHSAAFRINQESKVGYLFLLIGSHYTEHLACFSVHIQFVYCFFLILVS